MDRKAYDNCCNPAQVLLKAREVSHSVKLLFGAQISALNEQPPEELARTLSKMNLLQMLLVRGASDNLRDLFCCFHSTSIVVLKTQGCVHQNTNIHHIVPPALILPRATLISSHR
jgi:hypothetical protein